MAPYACRPRGLHLHEVLWRNISNASHLMERLPKPSGWIPRAQAQPTYSQTQWLAGSHDYAALCFNRVVLNVPSLGLNLPDVSNRVQGSRPEEKRNEKSKHWHSTTDTSAKASAMSSRIRSSLVDIMLKHYIETASAHSRSTAKPFCFPFSRRAKATASVAIHHSARWP